MFVAHAAVHNRDLRLVDFVTAYLHAIMPYTIYAHPPPGFERKGWLWLILKAYYGHPESGRLWYDVLDEIVVKFGFKPLAIDKASYSIVRDNDPQHTTLLTFHVDDGLHVASEREHLALVKFFQKGGLRCKNLG